jgi:hypothetical protein
MSESVGSAEFLLGIEEYLRYIKQDKQADSVHSLSRTIESDLPKENSIKSFFQDFSADLQETDKPSADLMHCLVKSNNQLDVCKGVLSYLSKKLENDKNITDLIHNINKSEDILSSQKAVLQLVGKTVFSNKPMADMALAIHRSLDSAKFEDEFIRAQLSMLDRQFLNDKIFRGINNYLKLGHDKTVINDAFSRSQIKSKIWLIDQLYKINYNWDYVVVMAGWFGQLKAIYEKQCTYAKMRIIELDRTACETSDYLFNLSNLENYKVKSVNADINNLVLHKNGYEWTVENFRDATKYSEKFLPDLIINTSAEHMKEDWFFQIKFKELESDPVVAIQSNNLFDIEEHINCVHSVEHMKKKFPMREIFYEGELQLKGYKRVMLIGKP